MIYATPKAIRLVMAVSLLVFLVLAVYFIYEVKKVEEVYKEIINRQLEEAVKI